MYRPIYSIALADTIRIFNLDCTKSKECIICPKVNICFFFCCMLTCFTEARLNKCVHVNSGKNTVQTLNTVRRTVNTISP